MQAHGTPQNSKKYVCVLYAYVVCRINSVLIRMGRLKSPYDPSLFFTYLLLGGAVQGR